MWNKKKTLVYTRKNLLKQVSKQYQNLNIQTESVSLQYYVMAHSVTWEDLISHLAFEDISHEHMAWRVGNDEIWFSS